VAAEDTCDTVGVLGPQPMIASIEAAEAIKLLWQVGFVGGRTGFI